jgi:hypothetical protein
MNTDFGIWADIQSVLGALLFITLPLFGLIVLVEKVFFPNAGKHLRH